MKKASETFKFYECIMLTRPTGNRASNLKDFLNILEESQDSVIFHHLYQSHLKYLNEVKDYPNDFANWAADSLEDLALAEKLASFDPYDFQTVSEAKEMLIEIIEEHMWDLPTIPWVRPGFEFYFTNSATIFLPLGIEVTTLAEFNKALPDITENSVYFHFYEARKRHKNKVHDDFSYWIEDNFEGEDELVKTIRDIDFYFFSLNEIRKKLLHIFDQRFKQ
jgi:hypothetical protein